MKIFRTPSHFSLLAVSYQLLAISLSSCDPDRVFEENRNMEDYIWKADQKAVFNVNITDSITPHNLFINVRNTDNYKYSNIYLFVTTAFPGGQVARDTLECILADDQGHWLGDGLGDIWDNRIFFKKNVRFPSKGTYTITLEHAMRTEELKDIMDVGVRVEKQSP